MASHFLQHLAVSFTRQVAQMNRLTWNYLPAVASYRCLYSLSAAPRLPSSASVSGIQPAACGPSLLGQCRHLPSIQPADGMKTKSALRRRCKDCFFVRRRGRLFVFCKTNPRHKQRQG
ncbi:large ribosomal subunit protein bL36m isoform X1 [Phyllopteryx taeniolatus]|uniref:large ribosomal subunit protein bL36m isoform X1 n=1 Tax=Phyllopteryx taeniolatus TaxID=161469 RepID=UPI002AD29376|nr:large ribosomal subunit protein bL36m isoform X1 [Phyllopteryx taeniolatus]